MLALEYLIGLLVAALLLSQVAVPILRGKRPFPLLRREQPWDQALREASEEESRAAKRLRAERMRRRAADAEARATRLQDERWKD